MAGKARKARKLVLSPTKIVTWLECRLKYKFAYVDKLGRFYYKPNRDNTFGASMHRALQMFHDAGGAASVASEDLSGILQTSWISSGFQSRDEEEEFLQRGQQMFQSYYEALAPSAEGPGAAHTLLTEKQLRFDYGSFVLMGRLDRLDEHADGSLEIIDYKSGRTEVEEADVHDSLAMACYCLLVGKRYPGRKVSASIIGLAGGCSATTSFSAEEMEVFEEDVKEIARQIDAAEEYPPNYSPICESCIFSPICYEGGPVDWRARRRAYEASQEGAW